MFFNLKKLNAKLLMRRDGLGGLFIIAAISLLYFFSLKETFSYGNEFTWQDFWQDNYLHHIIYFSFFQAILSAILSILFGFLFARAFFYQQFKGKHLVLKLFSLTFVLPALVAIFGLMGIYGHSGWVAQIIQYVGLNLEWDFYGLSGILIAHLFFNIPLASRMFLQSLQNIPHQQRQLAAQLNIRGWHFIHLIEFPYLKQQLLPTLILIFMLCFTSFTIVLTLGGGPKYTTLEVAIYQAIFFDFDLTKAALFALLQFVFCFILFTSASIFSKAPDTTLHNQNLWLDKQSKGTKIWQQCLILLTLGFISLPLLNTIITALTSGALFSSWQNPQLWKALGYSLTLAPSSATLAIISAMALLYLSRRLTWLQQRLLANSLLNIGMIILAIPTLVLALGLFLLLREIDFNTLDLFIIVMVCNALAALPFVIRVLSVPMNNNMQYYEKLCQSLGIHGWQRLRIIEWHTLKSPMQYAFALACTLSLGDFTAIALFGNQDFTSLPQLLYQQLASYQIPAASVTALLLLLFCAFIFYLVEDLDDKH